MIINIKEDRGVTKNLITLDLRTKQIRYLTDVTNQGDIMFLNISNDDVSAYEFLFKRDRRLFFKSLKEDLKGFLNIDIELKDLEVLK